VLHIRIFMRPCCSRDNERKDRSKKNYSTWPDVKNGRLYKLLHQPFLDERVIFIIYTHNWWNRGPLILRMQFKSRQMELYNLLCLCCLKQYFFVPKMLFDSCRAYIFFIFFFADGIIMGDLSDIRYYSLHDI